MPYRNKSKNSKAASPVGKGGLDLKLLPVFCCFFSGGFPGDKDQGSTGGEILLLQKKNVNEPKKTLQTVNQEDQSSKVPLLPQVKLHTSLMLTLWCPSFLIAFIMYFILLAFAVK